MTLSAVMLCTAVIVPKKRLQRDSQLNLELEPHEDQRQGALMECGGWRGETDFSHRITFAI